MSPTSIGENISRGHGRETQLQCRQQASQVMNLGRARLTGVTHATYLKKKQIRGNSEPRDLILWLLLVVAILRRALHQHRTAQRSRKIEQVIRVTMIGRATMKEVQGKAKPTVEEAKVAQLRR